MRAVSSIWPRRLRPVVALLGEEDAARVPQSDQQVGESRIQIIPMMGGTTSPPRGSVACPVGHAAKTTIHANTSFMQDPVGGGARIGSQRLRLGAPDDFE